MTFVDGTAGEVDMRAFLNRHEVAGTVFEPLREPAAFVGARVTLGAVSWPCGAELAPDAMYDEIKRSGRWELD